MAITFVDGQTVTTGAGTEDSLVGGSPQTDDCILQVWLDLINLVSGDLFRLRIREKVATTQRLVEEWYFSGGQSRPAFTTPTLIVGTGWDITLEQLGPTTRTIPWSLRKIT